MLPIVSIIIPVKNEDKYIIECLNSIFNLDYPGNNYEVLVVADGDAKKEVFTVLESYKRKVRPLKSKKTGSAANRNLGVKSASKKSKYFAFTDADCIVDKNWLKNLVERIEKAPKEIGCVGGVNLVPKSDSDFAKIIGAMEQTLFAGGGSAQSSIQKKEKFVVSIPNCNAIYRKELWSKNKQDESLIVGQDGEFNYRLWRKGVKFVIVPNAIVWHHRTKTPRGFIRRMYKYGEATARIFKKHKELKFLSIRWYGLLPVFALILFIAFGVLSFYSRKSLCILSYLFGLYLLLDLLTSASVLYRTKKAYSLISFFLIPLQHLFYAIGFFKGILTQV